MGFPIVYCKFEKFDKKVILNPDMVFGGGINTDCYGGDCIDDTCKSNGDTEPDVYIGSC